MCDDDERSELGLRWGPFLLPLWHCVVQVALGVTPLSPLWSNQDEAGLHDHIWALSLGGLTNQVEAGWEEK